MGVLGVPPSLDMDTLRFNEGFAIGLPIGDCVGDCIGDGDLEANHGMLGKRVTGG